MSYQSTLNTRLRFSSIMAGSAGKPTPGFPGHFPTTSTVREADRCLHNRKQRGPALHSTRPGLSSHTSMRKEVRKLPSADSWLCSQGFPMLAQRVLDVQTLG